MTVLINDRYSRLRAIKEYGFDIDFSELKNKTVSIIGVGGLGSLSAEMLARCGVGKIIILDLDTVEEANLNRIMYKPEHIGRKKAEVCTEILHDINPDVMVEFIAIDIMNIEFEQAFELILAHSDLILNGLDNVPARQYLNVKCVSLNKPYIDAGALRSGFGGYVHLVIPHKTACYQCTASVQINSKTNDVNGPQCAASLPSTLAIISSLQVQHALKYLLNFGLINDFISYNGLNDEFTFLKLQRDENCYVCGAVDRSVNKPELVKNNSNEINDLIKELNKKDTNKNSSKKKVSRKKSSSKKKSKEKKIS